MTPRSGLVEGRHFTEYVPEVKRLYREGRLEVAERLLLRLVDAAEEQARIEGLGVAPWYYGQLAAIYRRQGRVADEVRVLERFAKQPHAPGKQTLALTRRLEDLRPGSGGKLPAGSTQGWPPLPDAVLPEPVVPRNLNLVGLLRSARGYDGRPVVAPDAPKRTRDREPSVRRVAAPMRPPPLEKIFYERRTLTPRQQHFYEGWRSALEEGEAWEVEGEDAEVFVNYLYTYTKDVIPLAWDDPGSAAIRLERLARAYPVVSHLSGTWARDAWLLAGDLRGALDCLPRLPTGKVASFEADRRLTLRFLLGEPLDAWDLFPLAGPKVTATMKDRIETVAELVNARLHAEQASGQSIIDDLFRVRGLTTSPWPLWNATLQALPVDEARYANISHLPEARDLVYSFQRTAENALREDAGLPAVGQGWISETLLFTQIREALDVKVIQHGIPEGFGRQHLDVWIPEWRVGVEFQGPQHDGPVEFFGGQVAFEQTAKRDRHKVAKARRLGIALVYVRPSYDLRDVLAEIEKVRKER